MGVMGLYGFIEIGLDAGNGTEDGTYYIGKLVMQCVLGPFNLSSLAAIQ